MLSLAGEWVHANMGMEPAVFNKIVVSVSIFLVLWIVRAAALVLIRKRTEDVRTRYWWSKSSLYILVILAVLLVGRTWLVGFDSLTTFLGLVSAGLAIALKDLVVSLAGWIFIISRQPFKLGDRIQCGKHAGDVIDIGVFQFTLLEVGNWVDADQSTGRIIQIPNGVVFSQSVANYTRGFQYIWNELPVLITFESNWEEAREILFRIVRDHGPNPSESAQEEIKEASREFMIFYPTLDPIVYTRVADSGVLLTIRYICHPRNRRNSAEKLWMEILREFSRCDGIDFAYPTQRFFDNTSEGKMKAAPVSPPAS
ncbi:MAG: mechanosensitive ion channel family protein [bacterium]|nr:mechanosensitive ion channel family protein [bacterium]